MQSNPVENIVCLVDSDIAIDFLRKREYARKLFEHWVNEGLLAISTITHLEIYQGMKPDEEIRTNIFLDGFITVSVDIYISRLAGRMLGKLRSRGITVGIADAIIGATALTLGAPLLTNNIDHYPFDDLNVIQGSDKQKQ